MRFAVISDIHEDAENLQLAMKHIVKSDVDEIICLGDVVGFEKSYYKFNDTRSAKRCLEILNHHSVHILAGNHELNQANRLPFFNKDIGFPDDWYSIPLKDKIHRYEHLFFLYMNEEPSDLNKKEIQQLKNLKSWQIFNTNPYCILFSHFIYPDINGNSMSFYNHKKNFQTHFNWMKLSDVRFSFVGHLHLNGIGILRKERLRLKKFGLYSLSTDLQIIFCPAIARGRSTSGYVIFDTDDLEVEAVKL